MLNYPFLWLFYHPKIKRMESPKGVIVIIECWFTFNPYHKVWCTYLEKKGYRTLLVRLPFMFDSFEISAKKLAQYIKARQLTNYTLVGISTGALVGLCYLNCHKKWKEVNNFISIGGPLHGTLSALFIALFVKGRAMLPGSAFLKNLHSYPIPQGKMITVSAEVDELVSKSSNKTKGAKSYIVSIWGHNRIHLGSRTTYDLIAKLAAL